MKSNCMVIAAAAAAEPPGQGKLFSVCCGLCWAPPLYKQEPGKLESLAEPTKGFGARDVWAVAGSWVWSIQRRGGSSYYLALPKGVLWRWDQSPKSHRQGARVDRHNLQEGEIQLDIRKKKISTLGVVKHCDRGQNIELRGEATVKKKFRKPCDGALLSRW